MKKRILKLITIVVFILIEEIIFSLITINSIGNLGFKILFSIEIGLLIDIITNIFKEKTNKKTYIIILSVITLIYVIYNIFYKLLNTVLSVVSIKNGIQQSGAFSSIIYKELLNNGWYILLFLIPLVGLIIIAKKIDFNCKGKKIEVISIVAVHIMILSIILGISREGIYSYKNLYFNVNNPGKSLKEYGLLTTIRIDIQRTLIGFEEKELYKNEDEETNLEILSTNEYNVLDIDFDNLISQEQNEQIKEIYEYIKAQQPSNKNEYTGKYNGKNLIVFVAESFSKLAIDKDITPTLYYLANEGIQFENFYTPLFPVSTADGQYLTDTSLLPVEGLWSIENVEENTFPYSYGNVFKKQGYSTYAYHNYNYDFYKRHIYFDVMGYDTYLANGTGLEKRMSFEEKPTSDYEMVKTTIEDYINEDKFVAYYITMSGHMEYDNTNSIVRKNWDLVKELPHSDKAKAYLATQIELDKAVKEVIDRLKEEDRLEDTVIMITSDHYPYGLDIEEMQELSEETLDKFEKFHMPFILYNSQEKNNIVVKKYSSSLDVLPTILNLFGVKYDSRLLMGTDIFSDNESLIIFSDRSYITQYGRYNSDTEKWEGFNEKKEIEEEEIKNKKSDIYNKYRYSRLILKYDFYKNILIYLY